MAISTKIIGGVTYWYSQSTSVVKLNTAGKYLNYNIYIEPPTLSGDAAASNVLSGKTFYNSYTQQTGTMTNQGAISATKNPTFSGATASYSYTISAGYHNGSGTVSGSATMSNATTSTSGSASGSGTVTPGSVTVAANTSSVSGKTRVASTPTTSISDISTYYIAVKPSVAAGSSTSISVSGTATTTVSAAGYISSDKSGTVSGSATVNSTAKDGSVYYLPLATGGCTVAGGGLSKGTASGGGLSGGGLSGGGLSGAGDVGIDIYEVGSSSQDANVTLSCVDIGSKDTTNYPYYFKVAAAGTTKTITRAQIDRAKIDRAAFSQTVSRAAVTDTHTAGYLPAQSATTVIAADSSTVSLAAGSIAADSIASTTASVTAAEKVEYVKMKAASPTRDGNTVSWSEGYTGSGSSTGTTTSRSAGSGGMLAISGVTFSDYLTTTASGNYGGFYGYGTVSTGTGWVTSGSTNSNYSSTYYIKAGSVSRSGNTVTWTTGWVVGSSSTGDTTSATRDGNKVSWGTGWITAGDSTGSTTSRSASTGTLTAISGVTLSDYLTTTSSSGVGGFYGYGAVSTGTGWVTSGSTNSSNSSTYYIKKGSATTPTASGASTYTSLSGTTLTVSRSVTPTVSAGWVTSGTAGTVTITGTVPTESKSVDPSTVEQTITPTSGTLLSSVTIHAMPSSYKNYVVNETYYMQSQIQVLGTTSQILYYRTLSNSVSYNGRTYYKLCRFSLNDCGAYFTNGVPLSEGVPYLLGSGNVKYTTTSSSTSHTSASFTLYGVKDGNFFWVLVQGNTLYPGGVMFTNQIVIPGNSTMSTDGAGSSGTSQSNRFKIMSQVRQVSYPGNTYFTLPDTLYSKTTTGIVLLGYYHDPTSSWSSMTLANTFIYKTFSPNKDQIQLRLYDHSTATTFTTYYIPRGGSASTAASHGESRLYQTLSGYYLCTDPTYTEQTHTGQVGFTKDGYGYVARYKSTGAIVYSTDTWSDDIISIFREA